MQLPVCQSIKQQYSGLLLCRHTIVIPLIDFLFARRWPMGCNWRLSMVYWALTQ
jgi:hypothetical protein